MVYDNNYLNLREISKNMEIRFKSLSLFEFQAMFPDNNTCEQYLAWPY